MEEINRSRGADIVTWVSRRALRPAQQRQQGANTIKLLSHVSLSLIIDVFIDAKITNIFFKDTYIRLFL